MKTRIFACCALMGLWLALLAAQSYVVTEAMARSSSCRDLMFWAPVLDVIPQFPGCVVVWGICTLFQNTCAIGGFLASELSNEIVMLLSDTIFYMTITYWIARGILKNARRETYLRTVFIAVGAIVVMANAAFACWMIWANKPHDVDPTPRLSVLSLIVACLTFVSAFWPVRSHGDV